MIDLVCSVYFQAHNREHYDDLDREFNARGFRLAAKLNHAKVMALELSDGRRFTIEGSGNLRSCGSVDNVLITADAGLFEFYKGNVERLINV